MAIWLVGLGAPNLFKISAGLEGRSDSRPAAQTMLLHGCFWWSRGPASWSLGYLLSPITVPTKHLHQLAPLPKDPGAHSLSPCVYAMTSFKCPLLCEVFPDSTWQSSATYLSQSPSVCCAGTTGPFVPSKGD